MVPYVKRHQLPLLPFERDLLQHTGISEEEYRWFVAEAMRMSKPRPAGYEYIPDIRMDAGLTIAIISLVIGIASTAVSVLMVPKPRSASNEQGRQKQLSNRNGAEAFAPTTGFDSQAQLATYGEPIPVLFGRYTGTTGGMLFSPKLVWSRAQSYGRQQGVKMMFVVGEQGVGNTGIDKPDLSGIFLGNTPLDAAFDHTFAFYWRSGTFNGTSRIKGNNLRYGTRGTPDSGDPENAEDVFEVSLGGTSQPAFCNAYSPTSNSEFGAFAPIYNGTDHRVNWRIIAIAKLPDATDDPNGQMCIDRVKIAGSYGYDFTTESGRALIKAEKQRGFGRGYSRKMAITRHNSYQIPSSGAETESRYVSVGDTCVFTILGDRIPRGYYYTATAQNTQVDDINSELDSQCAAADAQLQLGETFQIGYTVWKVIGRLLPIWRKGQTQEVTLRCVELLGTSDKRRQIGLVRRNLLVQDIWDDNRTVVPTSYYPLMRFQVATVRNARPCNVTEIGIRSQVWNRANGLCNFASLCSPAELGKAEQDRMTITSGTMTLYFKRTSAFALQFRLAGVNSSGVEYNWSHLEDFCVTSESPVDLYNCIRIAHPTQQQYEYRLVPRSGADMVRHMASTDLIWRLDARDSLLSKTYSSPFGTVTIRANGALVSVDDITFNEEMATLNNTGTGYQRIFEANSQLTDVSFYGNLLNKSNESSPEHAISYVNEIVANPATPNYDNLVTAGLAIKASRAYSSLDQIRMWKDDGVPVLRFHPDEAGTVGPSNLLTDLLYYFLTDKTCGAGAVISPAQIKTSDFAETARFLRANKLFFDGAIVEPSNIRELITQLAPFFLCNFVIADGLFSLVPALPVTAAGGISTAAVPISALFTSGNIVEESFSIDYISSEERDSLQAVVRYRQGVKNQLPEEKTLTVRWNEAGSTSHKLESFDLTQYCTSRDHALLAAKHLLSVRRRITHTVKFKTSPYGLNLAPGKLIRVVTQANPYSGANNGVIGDDGVITSISPLANGSYNVIFYKPPATAVATTTLTVSNGATTQTSLFGSVFTVTTASTQNNIYLIEQLSLDEEGMVEISASEFPTDASYRSLIALDVVSTTAFATEG